MNAIVGISKECIFSIQSNGTDGALDGIGVEVDPAVLEEFLKRSSAAPISQSLRNIPSVGRVINN